MLTVSAMEPSTCLSTHSYLGSGDTCCPPHPTPHLCFRPTSQVSRVWLCPTTRPCQDLQPGAKLSPGALSSATSVSVLALGRFIWEDQFPCCPEREGCVGLLPVAEGWVGIASGLTQALPAGPSPGPVSLGRQALRPGPCGSPPPPPAADLSPNSGPRCVLPCEAAKLSFSHGDFHHGQRAPKLRDLERTPVPTSGEKALWGPLRGDSVGSPEISRRLRFHCESGRGNLRVLSELIAFWG